jgi:transposase
MGGTLSEDLRWRIVKTCQKGELTIHEIAALFGVGTATVKRLKKLFLVTKSVAPKPHGGGAPRKITSEQETLVEALVQQHPDWSEDQYADCLAEKHDIHASAVTVGRVIRRLGYSVKKRPSSRKNATAQTSSTDELATSSESKTSPLRVWFLWTKPARTRR